MSEEFSKRYVASKAETNFVDVIPQSRRLRLPLNLDFPEIDDPRGLCNVVTSVGRRENATVTRLAELFSHAELEKLLGELVYTVRCARTQLTGEDRRGTKTELAAALVIQHGIDLRANGDIRKAIAKKLRIDAPSRWHPGKGIAPKFTETAEFPKQLAGIPSADTPPDFEYLERRLDLAPLQDFQIEVHEALLKLLDTPKGKAIVTLPTGAGKTRTAVDTIRDWVTARWTRKNDFRNGHTILWLAHTEELCEQAYVCFKQVWQASSHVSPLQLFRFWGRYTRDFSKHRENLLAMRERPSGLISTPHCMVKLIGESKDDAHGIRAEILATARLVIIDEAHRAAAPSYRAVLDAFGNTESDTRIIGLTATPFRAEYLPSDETSGTRELKQIFRKIIEPMRTLGADPRIELQQRGYLAKPMWDSIETKTLLKPPPLEEPETITEDDMERIDFALKKTCRQPGAETADPGENIAAM